MATLLPVKQNPQLSSSARKTVLDFPPASLYTDYPCRLLAGIAVHACGRQPNPFMLVFS